MSSRTYYDNYHNWTRPTSRSSSYYSKTPTSVTAKYLLSVPSHKSSSIPIRRDGSVTRDVSPVDNVGSSTKAEENKALTKYDQKYNNNKLNLPATNNSRSTSPVSPTYNSSVSHSRYMVPNSKSVPYKNSKSPESLQVDSEKSILNKNSKYDKPTNFNYKIYPRTSVYSRAAIRTEVKPEISVNRYLSHRQPMSLIKPTDKSVSPDPAKDKSKSNIESSQNNTNEKVTNKILFCKETSPMPKSPTEIEISKDQITLITRHTSPTPPGCSLYVRSRRADLGKTNEETIAKPNRNYEMADKEVQTEKIDESVRTNNLNNLRTSGRSSYSPGINNYTGFAGRFSTQYSSLSPNNSSYYYDRSSRSRSKEPISIESLQCNSFSDKAKQESRSEKIQEQVKGDEVSEIMVNVNLKLKTNLKPQISTSTESVSPESSSKIVEVQSLSCGSPLEENIKGRRKKIRKTSTDSLSSSNSSKSRNPKKRSKSVTSTDLTSATISKEAKKCENEAGFTHRKSPDSNTKSKQSTPSGDESLSKSDLLSDFSLSNKSRSQSVEEQMSKTNVGHQLDGTLDDVGSKSKFQDNDHNLLESSASESTSKDVSNITTESEITNKGKSVNMVPFQLKIVKTINSIEKSDKSEKCSNKNTTEPTPNSKQQSLWRDTTPQSDKGLIDCRNDVVNSKQSFRRFIDDEKPWWLDSTSQIPDGVEHLSSSRNSSLGDKKYDFFNVRHIDSGEKKDWWLSSSDPSSSIDKNGEVSNRLQESYPNSSQSNRPGYRIRHIESGEKPWWLHNSQSESLSQNEMTDIVEPLEDRRSPDGLEAPTDDYSDREENPWCRIDSTEVKIHSNIPQYPVIKKYSRENAIVLQTPVSIRVPALIERLMQSEGRELRRALLSLKQMLQSDDELVESFLENKGLDCLLYLANKTDCHYFDYILRAFEQVLLYEDGMQVIMGHSECIQWLYTLLGSELRHIVKSAFKFLFVFIEYTEDNCLLLIDAIKKVDSCNGRPPWFKVMQLLQDVDSSDTELLIYATNLINKCLNNISDRKIYLDHVDSLLDQGIDNIIQVYMSKRETDLDLIRQLQIFEATLSLEDANESGKTLKQLHEPPTNVLKNRNSNESDIRQSKRYQINDKGMSKYTSGLQQRMQNGTLGHSVTPLDTLQVMRLRQPDTIVEIKEPIAFNRENSIKEITEKLTTPSSPVTEEKLTNLSEMAGIVLKAKEELAKSQTKERHKSPIFEAVMKPEIKRSENDIHWEELKKTCMNREFNLCDLDFSDLQNDSDEDILSVHSNIGGAPPPPPPPAIIPLIGAPPPPPPGSFPRKNSPVQPNRSECETSSSSLSMAIKKNKKTVKLFWKEILGNPLPATLKTKVGGFFWDDLPEISLDTKKLEHLFESRSNDLIMKDKMADPKRNIILDAKRSNAINIAMKKLPTPQTIKVAILKMDATVIGRESIEKLLTMLPTEEERIKIQEAQDANPDLPLGSAEQFLLTLDSIPEITSRLKLWVFKLDFDNTEKEIAESLMDLKHGLEQLKDNKTFKLILSTLRSVGSFLNGNSVKGFRLDYLSKVMEVKDTVHKHPLLYHLCDMILDKYPETTDLFSEVGPVIRASKVDFDMLNVSLTKLESDCKSSWDHLKKVTKNDGSQMFRTKINDFLRDAAERIILLTVIKKRVMNRYAKFLLYLGIPLADIEKTKPSEFLKVIAEFALEYRTTRERVLQHIAKKANHQSKNKSSNVAATSSGSNEVSKTFSKADDGSADSALRNILKSVPYTESMSENRRKHSQAYDIKNINGDLSEGNEMIESLVRSTNSKRQTTNGRNRSQSRTEKSKHCK